MEPIIASLLDNDAYQATMSQYAFEYHRDDTVRYQFRNRSFQVPLAARIDLDELRNQLGHVVRLALSDGELDYLRGLGYFSEEFLSALQSWQIRGVTGIDADVHEENGHLVLEYEGPWWQTVWFETPFLAIVNEMYFRRFDASEIEGMQRLDEKIKYLAGDPRIRFAEFGTRRRYSGIWQRNCIEQFVKHSPAMVGTSNLLMAKDFRLRPIGTMAHQLFMVQAARAMKMAAVMRVEPSPKTVMYATDAVLDAWRALYFGHPELMTMLPDTYTTRFFTRYARHSDWVDYGGVRQDSGDPIEMGELVLSAWQGNDLDPHDKRLIFSDGLDVRQMSLLCDRFCDRTQVSFGWGTNLTNDLGFEPLSIVIKPSAVNGIPAVKISDDIRKATGDRAEIDRYLELIGHHGP